MRLHIRNADNAVIEGVNFSERLCLPFFTSMSEYIVYILSRSL